MNTPAKVAPKPSLHEEDAQQDAILHNLMLFTQVLRRVGLDVASGNVLDLVRATEYAPLGHKRDFQEAARCLLVHRKQDLPLFDEAFQVFWRKPASGQGTRDLRSMGEQRRYRNPQAAPPSGPDSGAGSGDSETGDQPEDQVYLTHTYSAREVLRGKDFSEFTPAEILQAKAMMAQFSWDLGRRKTRRLVSGGNESLDLRKTLRRNLKYGGEPLELVHRQRKNKLRPLVFICDVSGSMERYTRMLLHFIHTVAGDVEQVEAFLFATRLTRITRHLAHRSVDQSVDQVAKAVPDWAGGTRIGEALKTFNYQWLRRVSSGGAVALIISDGWDRGDPDLLAREAARLQRSCHRLIWLNPLLGSANYEPLTRGMQAALPYVDDFLAVNNLSSLQALARHLSQLDSNRSLGAQVRATPDPESPARPEPEADMGKDGAGTPGYSPVESAGAPTFRHPMWRKQR